MTAATLDPLVIDQQTAALSAELQPVIQDGALVRVVDESTYIAAGEFGMRLKAAEKRVVDFFKPLKDAAYKLHKEICGRETTALQPIRTTLAAIDASAGTWRKEQDRKRREEEARLQDEARKAEDARRLAEAASLEAAGHAQAAAIVLEQAVQAPAPSVVLQDTTPEIAGQSFVKVWKWRPIGGDRAAAIRLVPREWLDLNDAAITGAVKHSKGMLRIPGIEIYEDEGTRRKIA